MTTEIIAKSLLPDGVNICTPYGEVTQSAGVGLSGYGYTGEYHSNYFSLGL